MDMQTLINWALTAVATAIGYFYRQQDGRIKDLEIRINAQALKMSEDYVKRDELSGHLNRIESMLTRIFDKLDNKVDK
jgi:hypothetical protein